MATYNFDSNLISVAVPIPTTDLILDIDQNDNITVRRAHAKTPLVKVMRDTPTTEPLPKYKVTVYQSEGVIW